MKKFAIPFACALSLAACGPSNDKIAGDVQQQIQAKVQNDLKLGAPDVKVEGITVVNQNGSEYAAAGNLDAFGVKIPLNFKVLADREHTIIQADTDSWRAIEDATNRARLQQLDGKYSDKAATIPSIFALFPPALQARRTEFTDRLETISSIHTYGPYLFGQGCKAHECLSDETAWVINKNTGKAYAILLETSPPTNTPNFYIFGGELQELPSILVDWAADKGMTEINYGIEHDPS
ncbi:hypothetical protein [Paraburkholderia sp.]|uniref:hypothetical protein n=1 Tax=Paraburkholderia sp. TaxID=1926495 RepID=UPI00286EEABE|nr:hypothetical protein [Paraburkholderia sp.]